MRRLPLVVMVRGRGPVTGRGDFGGSARYNEGASWLRRTRDDSSRKGAKSKPVELFREEQTMGLTSIGKGIQISLSDLQEEMNHLFDRMWHAGISTAPLDGQKWAPVIDVLDEPTQYILTAEVPGLSVDDIDVSYEQGEVVVKGHKSAERGDSDDIQWVRRERRFGSFCRRVAMPERINAEGISAKCRNGLLEIILPKKEIPERTAIKIDVEE
jgi:HSP20 family protein